MLDVHKHINWIVHCHQEVV